AEPPAYSPPAGATSWVPARRAAALGRPRAGANPAGVKPAARTRAASVERLTAASARSLLPLGRFQSTWVSDAVDPARSSPPVVGASPASRAAPAPVAPVAGMAASWRTRRSDRDT